jgi:hypothetical protein
MDLNINQKEFIYVNIFYYQNYIIKILNDQIVFNIF